MREETMGSQPLTRFALIVLCLAGGVSAFAKTPVQVLQEAAERWQGIHDYSAYFQQRNTQPGGERVFLGKISLCRLSEGSDRSYLRLDYFDVKEFAPSEGPAVIESDRLQDLYFSDGETLWHYRPAENQVTMEWLAEEGPFPEILLIAGFLKLDVEQFRATHYFKPLVTESIDGRMTYRITVVPKGEAKQIEPLRDLWLDQDSLLPTRVAARGEASLVVDLRMQKTDQNLDPQTLIPLIPKTAVRIDLRQQTRQWSREENWSGGD